MIHGIKANNSVESLIAQNYHPHWGWVRSRRSSN
jgi:hypothetical protein